MTILGVAHASPVMLDRDESLRVAVDWIEQAAEQSVDLLAFAESFLPGFPYWVNMAPPPETGELFSRLYRAAVPTEQVEQALAPILDACHTTGVDVVIGLTERQGGTLYNALGFVDARTRSVPLVRRKLVPTGGERSVWGFGDASTLRSTDLGGVRVSGMMCYEHVMALARHALAVEQPEVHVAAWPGMAGLRGYDGFHRQVDALARSHALMSQSFVLSAMNPVPQASVDRLLEEIPDLGLLQPSGAWSAIFDPSGQVVAEYEGSEEQLVVAEVDLGAHERAKRIVDVGHFGRAECLSLHVDRTPYSFQRLAEAPEPG